MPLDFDIFGEGIYTPRDAARLLGASHHDVLRWTRGSGTSDPLWHAHYQFMDDTTEISFIDLIEIRAVRALRKAGISLQAIRFAIKCAEEKYGIPRPLSSLQFKTDGTEILMEAVEQDGDYVSLAAKRPGQKVFSKLISQSVKDLEYEGGQAARWRPENSPDVIIDPRRSFGAPILDAFGISTDTIYKDYQAGQVPAYLAKVYELPKKLVIEAISFEQALDSGVSAEKNG